MNQVNLIGNIGSEPEIKAFQSGKKVARFSVAINGYSKDKDKKPAATWVPCEMWDAAVERLSKCKEKAKLTGRKIQITGSLALNVYSTTVGNEQKTMKKLYVKVHTFELLGGLKNEEPAEETHTVDEETGEVLDGQVVEMVEDKPRKRA
jgi:single-strand DNA-binding protein